MGEIGRVTFIHRLNGL